MSDTILAHPLVREYLRELNIACAYLPLGQVRELREQIAAHLDEALPPGATMADVEAELARLGGPRSLAAAAAAPERPPVLRRLRNRLGHVPWWAWGALALLVPVIGTGTGFLVSMKSAAPLTVVETGWLYPVDQARAVSSTADMITQTTIPSRTGQRQGILLGIVNNSNWTQVILGAQPEWDMVVFSEVRVDVESGPHLSMTGEPHNTASYRSPGVIPPHSFRFVHVSWASQMCPSNLGEVIVTDIELQIRVGVITRTEDLSLNQAFAVTGGHAPPCG